MQTNYDVHRAAQIGIGFILLSSILLMVLFSTPPSATRYALALFAVAVLAASIVLLQIVLRDM